MARLFPINVPLTIVWHFNKPDNTDFDITGYEPRLYYRSGNRETEVAGTVITKSGNTLSFTFPTTWPRFEGEYHLKLQLFQNNALWETFNYRQAWAFVRTAIPGSQEATQQNAGQTVHLFTCAEYYLFQPIIPTVDSDGYWVVNGTRVTDGSGNPVPSSHTVTYDAETNQIIIDQGRVDKNGNSIAQTITALDDALDNQADLYAAAEGTKNGSVSGDGSRWGQYKAAEAARNAARTTAEGTKNGSTAGDGSMWGEYKAAEAARNTARAASEGTKNGSTAGDGSMWGAFKEGEAARNEASENQEGTKAFSTESDGTRWGEYKNAERERDEARLAAEGSKQRSNAGDGTRWGDYKTAEGERDLQYAKEEGTAASEAHDGTRWGEYKAAEEERDASESRRDSTFNDLASDMRSATSAANTAAGAANTAAAGANTAAGKANAAAGRAPYIGENGHWYAWDIESGQYADTGVAALSNSRYEVVSELPDEGDGNILYLVGPNQQGAYDEYVYTKDGEFVQVGSTYVDLEEKVSSEDIDNIIELTQEEFDALQSKDPRAMYIVTNAVPDSDHVGIASLVQTTVATADEGVNVWTCTLTNGQTFTLNVKNGSRGNSGYTGAAGELEVVNALNSDDATAALSAYQGKVLDGKIDQLGQELHPVVTTDGMEIALIAAGPINADGSITSSNTGYRRCTITNDGYTRISGHGSSYTGYLILAFYNSASPSAASLISGIAATYDYVDQSFDVSVPAGTVTIIVSYSTNGSATPSTITLYKPSNILETLEDGLQDISDDVDILKPTVEGLSAGFSAMVGTYTPASWTALAWGTVVYGKYWNLVDGEAGLVSASGYYANPSLLSINPGRTVKVTVKNANIPFGENSAAISLYDNDGLPAYVPGQGIARWNWGAATTKVDNGDGTATYTFLIPSGATQIGLYYKIDEVTFYISNPESISYSEGLDQHIEEVAGGGVTTSADSAKYYLKGASPKSFPSAKKIAILCAGQSNAEGRVPYANMPAEIQSAQPITNCHYVEDSESGAFASLNITGQWAFDLVTYYNICVTANKEIYVMKWAAGGTSIDPLGDGTYHWTADYEDLSSPGYSLLRKFENEIRNHIASDGENFAIRAMLWHQGEGDRGSLGTGSDDRYYENLRNMVSYIRGIVGDERLPFITGTISHNSAQYDAKIEAAQQRLASEDPYFCLIDMSGAPLLDSYHFDDDSSVYFGQMAYNALIDYGVLSATKLTPVRPW